jgi:hypothetical protein
VDIVGVVGVVGIVGIVGIVSKYTAGTPVRVTSKTGQNISLADRDRGDLGVSRSLNGF